MMKKFLSLALTLALVLGLMVPVALAGDEMSVELTNTTESDQKDQICVGESLTATVTNVPATYDHISWDYEEAKVSVSLSTNKKVATITGVDSVALTNITVNVYETADDTATPIATKTFSITVTPAKLSKVSLDKTSVDPLVIGNSTTVTATAKGTDGKTMSGVVYSWSCDSSFVSIATTDSASNTCKITAKEKGNAQVVCTVTDGNITKSSTCYVYVSDSSTSSTTTKLTGVSLNNSTLSIDVGDTETLKATTSGTCDRDDVDFTWTSSNTSVAYITSDDGEGEYTAKIKGKKAGTATITCEAYYKGKTVSATCKVTVGDGDDDDGDFYIKTDLDPSYTATAGVSYSISFTLENKTGKTAYYQWYVDGKEDNSSSKNFFNVGTLPVGTYKVSCKAYTKNEEDKATTKTCTVTVMSSASSGSMTKFKATKTYNGEFTDVNAPTEANPDGDWFYPYVKTSYEYGLVNGKGSTTTFCPNDSFTIAEALKIAACIHSTYHNGSDATQTNLVDKAGTGADWYKVYADYCTEKGIITSTDFSDYNANCTRAQMAYIFSRCLPATELTAVRTVTIPDCNSSTPYFINIQTLYNAGVVSGDATHSYYPDNPIKRSEMAKIVCTLVVPSTRDKATF